MTRRFADVTERLRRTGGAKWAVHLRCRELKRAGADIVELTIGEPDMPPDPSLIDAAERAMRAGRTGYADGRGEAALIQALVEKYRVRRADVGRDNVLCFPGTQTALFATLMGLVGEGDGVLVGDPFYATYEGVIRASGAHPVSVPLRADRGFHLCADDLERALTPACRALLLNTPHNPSGAVLDGAAIEAIGDICRKHDLWIISDEVYEELVFEGAFASPFDVPALADRTIALSSISKSCAAPGFRSGWAVGPAEVCERILPLSEAMLFGNQPFIADMTAFALRNPPDTAPRMRADYRRRSGAFAKGLGEIDGLLPYPPEAGMFILVDVGGTGLDGEAFAWGLLDAGVAVMPGTSFGDHAGDLIRLSLTVPDGSVALALERIERFVRTLG